MRDAARTLAASGVDPDAPIGRLGERLADLTAAGDRLFDAMIGTSPNPSDENADAGLTLDPLDVI